MVVAGRGETAVISVACCAAQPDPVVVLVQGPDIDRLRLGNYSAAEQRAGKAAMCPEGWSRSVTSVEPATQKFYGDTVLVIMIKPGRRT